MLKLTHANANGPVIINPAFVIAIYESSANNCTHIVTAAQVWPVTESVAQIFTAIQLLEKETKQ